MTQNGALTLADVRAACAAALAPVAESDPAVLPDLVDAVEPPALMLEWNDPWIAVRSIAGGLGLYDAQLNVLCLAGRVEPGPGVAMLEQLVAYTFARLQADPHPWPLTMSQAPRVFDIGGIPLLGARLGFRVPIQIGGST